MVWLPLPTVKLCWTWGAAFQLALPAWWALTMHVPAPTKVKTEPLVPPEVQTPADPELNVTVSPEVAVAAAVYVAPPTVAPPGAVEVKVMDWLPLPTVKLRWTWGA